MQKVAPSSRHGELVPIKSRTIEQAGRFVSTGGRSDSDVSDVLNNIFEDAVLNGSSDIHLEFDEIDGLAVRQRNAGNLAFMDYVLDADAARIARTKICAKAKLDDQERLVPQDGRMMVYFGNRRIDVRVAITPTVAGYKVVCRLLDSNNSNQNIDLLDMPFLVKEAMKRVASSPEGMVLLSGPTGSGKTTTLYAMMQFLNEETRHIVTIENPVEYAIKSFTQIDVDGNMTFSKAMKSSLRLDPDIIMVGEIRDEESASIAVKAGSSGHMVLSTIHCNSAAETLTRLLSFRLKSFEISSVLSAMIAQRLVRKIDDSATLEWHKPNDIEREWLTKRQIFSENMVFPKILPGEFDFKGRVPMVEMIELTPQMRTVMEDVSDDTNWIGKIIELAVRQEQFETLAQAGVRLALDGKTTLAEVMRATSDIGYIPSTRRFEQILIHQRYLNLDDLELIQREISDLRMEGKIVSLEQHLVDRKMCLPENVTRALKLSGHRTTN